MGRINGSSAQYSVDFDDEQRARNNGPTVPCKWHSISGILVFIIDFNESVSAQAVNLLHSLSYIVNRKAKVCADTGATLISYKVEN